MTMQHRGCRYGTGLLGLFLLTGCMMLSPVGSPQLSNQGDAANFNQAKVVSLPEEVVPSGEGGRFKLGAPYQVDGRYYYPQEDYAYSQVGVASWYGDDFQGKPTANGEIFDKTKISAAHKTLPLPSIVRLTNLDNGRSALVRVNDRGPFANDRILDVSEKTAEVLGFLNVGTARVRVEVVANASRALKEELVKSGRQAEQLQGTPNRRAVVQDVMPAMAAAGAVGASAGAGMPPSMGPTGGMEALTNNPAMDAAAAPDMPMAANTASTQTMEASAAPVEVVTTTNIKRAFYLQVAAYPQMESAAADANRIVMAGLSAVLYKVDVGGTMYYRVLSGSYASRAQAAARVAVLKKAGFGTVLVKRY